MTEVYSRCWMMQDYSSLAAPTSRLMSSAHSVANGSALSLFPISNGMVYIKAKTHRCMGARTDEVCVHIARDDHNEGFANYIGRRVCACACSYRSGACLTRSGSARTWLALYSC